METSIDYSKLSTRELYELTAKAEGYESVPVDIDTFLNDPYYLGQTYDNGKAVYSYWREALHKIYPNPLYSPYEEICLSGDTSVDLLDGTSLTMAEICEKYKGRKFWVLAFNTRTKEWEPCEAYAPKITGHKPVYKVTLDNGQWFKATAEHPILGKDNRWYRTSELKIGQSLMPYNITYDDMGYAYVWCNRKQRRVKRARLVQHWKNPIPKGYHTHHKDQVRANDVPSNIMALSVEDHFRIHNRLLGEAFGSPEEAAHIKAKMKVSHLAYRQAHPQEVHDACARGGKASWAAKSPEAIAKMREGQRKWVNSPEGKANSSRILQQWNKEHMVELKATGPARGKKAAVTRWQNASEAEHAKASRRLSALNASPEFQAKAAARQREVKKDKLLRRLNQMEGLSNMKPKDLPYPLQKVISCNFGCFRPGTENIDRVVLDSKWHEIVEQARNYNHRIVKIELLPAETVYNFTVDRLHNFTLSCGVVSHNCVTGCIGAGKTSFAIMGAMYDLYHVCLLREPQRKYKLLRTTRILFSLVTATKDLASAVMANQMLDVIAASPFFTSRFMPKKGEKLDEDMFPHHVGVGFGSRGGHNLGKAVIGAIIDEANFQEAVANQAVKNYETITRRMSSRFKLKNGSLPCRRWLVSSRDSDSSFLESHIEAVKNNPKVLVLAPAIWDVQKEKGIYSGKTFPVFIGTNTQQPMICTTEKEVEDHAGYIIEVPDVYREEFEENLPGALMDLAGVANRSSMSLIYNVEKWDACQCLDNAISKDEITLSIDGVDKIMDYMAKELPKHNYYVHLDGALKGDRFGFAMSAIEKQMTVSGRNLLTGEQTLRLSPSLITPIAFGIKARPGSEVPLWKVRQFLLDLRNKGVCIMQVSTDGFQSADMRQMLEKMGFNVKYVSVDTTKDPYLKFASNINHGLMKVPKSPILDFEVRHLENRDKKIDHPDKVMVNGRYVKGSKDIADAVSASQHEALLASLSLSAGTLVEQLGETQHLSMRGRQEYVQDMIFSMVQGNPDEHIAGGMY